MGLHEYGNVFMMSTKIYLSIVLQLSKEKCLIANTTLNRNCLLYINMYTYVWEWGVHTHKVQELSWGAAQPVERLPQHEASPM